jgi:hypothetical protein
MMEINSGQYVDSDRGEGVNHKYRDHRRFQKLSLVLLIHLLTNLELGRSCFLALFCYIKMLCCLLTAFQVRSPLVLPS